MSTGIPFRTAACLLLVAGVLCACSSIQPYRNSAPENMTISTDVRSGSASMHVYNIDNACNTSYQGTVDLSDKIVKTGMPANKPIYLVFNFEGGNYFTGYHSNSYDTYLTPRAGYRYETEVSYVDAMYGATVYERDAHGGRRKVQRVEPACAK